ncbi:DNA mismatch repair protein MSH5 [Entomortierella parvispora]|uniref:DNA mismatch repair protein MSH5 n=1 Tax=Entomortierella parvispora TaxID=205924 RepID=A0A9P3LZ42_9FUNG|nr:DNA mismatch repair protein MSH5 [Entomortierella parvispora]
MLRDDPLLTFCSSLVSEDEQDQPTVGQNLNKSTSGSVDLGAAQGGGHATEEPRGTAIDSSIRATACASMESENRSPQAAPTSNRSWIEYHQNVCRPNSTISSSSKSATPGRDGTSGFYHYQKTLDRPDRVKESEVPPETTTLEQLAATVSNNWTQSRPNYHFSESQQNLSLAHEADWSSTDTGLGREIILAIHVRGRTLGCAYYDGQISKLLVMNDLTNCNPLEMIENVKVQLRPTLVLASSRADEALLYAIQFDPSSEETKIEVRPANEFSFGLAKSRLVSVSVYIHRTSRSVSSVSSNVGARESDDWPIHYSEMDGNAQREALLHLSNVIDLQSTESIHAKLSVKDLKDIGAFINDVVDFDESVNEGRCVVKHNVDEELDRMRQNYHGLDSFLSEIAKEISLTIPSEFTSTINVIYFPQLGYLITMPMNPNWKTEQDFILDGLCYQFSTETTVYYKNNAMRGNELKQLHLQAEWQFAYREIDILQSLQEHVLQYSQLLVTCSDLCAELDVLVSFAEVARVNNYRQPTMSDQNILRIVKGRHPLQELVVNSFVANDTELGADNRVMVLTGANSSGKSIYLKQVALITYMAHVGCFVPAESAFIGLTDKILTRLQTRETVSSMQSAFMTDLHQVTLAQRQATQRSLVILDEFGKGTAATDGAGMFAGVIEHYAKAQSDNQGNGPKVVATTHFHELLENQLLDLKLPISLFTMEVYQEPSGLEATFLFRVIPGKTPSSLGPACASMANMPVHVVQRGIYLSGLFRRYERVVPLLTGHDRSLQRMYEQLATMLMSLALPPPNLIESEVHELLEADEVAEGCWMQKEEPTMHCVEISKESVRGLRDSSRDGLIGTSVNPCPITNVTEVPSVVAGMKRKDTSADNGTGDEYAGGSETASTKWVPVSLVQKITELLDFVAKVNQKEQEEFDEMN